MVCQGCDENKKLLKNHIIPRFFYESLKDGDDYLNVISTENPEKVSRSRNGDYDPNILCADCEALISKLDDYSRKLFVGGFESFKKLHQKDDRLVGWDMGKVDTAKLSRFVLSVLWRASISQRPFFKSVALGSHCSGVVV